MAASQNLKFSNTISSNKMQVYKFGGASVKDAQSVRNVAKILELHQGNGLTVVISAMGKTTNALEKIAEAYVKGETATAIALLNELKDFHYTILSELIEKTDSPLHDELSNVFVEVDWVLEEEPHPSYAFIYDQIVSIGELASTKIVSGYLQSKGIQNTWVDARNYLQTDNTYREGRIDWEKTEMLIRKDFPKILEKHCIITQGFIGGTSENFTTTLGREGSDYSAAIIASCLNAQSLTIWKDVPGVLNADPKLFPDTHKFDDIPYAEAIEMTYYGATVIHPKTIKPLQNKGIPLYVRPFLSPLEKGTAIGLVEHTAFEYPVIIVKKSQILLSIATRDLSFIAEEHLSSIFKIVADQQVKINLMQNSALSFSICVDEDTFKVPALIKQLQERFKVKYNEHLQLITVRHYSEAFMQRLLADKKLVLEQRSRNTVQLIVHE